MSETNETSRREYFAAELAAATVGCRVKFNWLGATRKVDDEHKREAAEVFGANAESLTLSKKLFDNKREEFRAVSAVKSAARKYWQLETLPFTEPGVRLIKREYVEEFSRKMESYSAELRDAVATLDAVYYELKDEARTRLGELFNPAEYPANLRESFAVAWEFPNLTAPEFLAEVNPALHERERQRLTAQFAESVALAEQAFADELFAMVERITSTLDGGDDGKPKVFRNSMIENANEFFERFRRLSIGSSAELESVIDNAQNALRTVTPAAIRNSSEVRERVRASMSAVQTQLETQLVDRPSRRIVVGSQAEPSSSEATEPTAELASEPEAEPSEAANPETTARRFVAGLQAEREPNSEAAATEPEATSEPEAEPPAEPEADGVAFNLNYGGGVVRRVVMGR